MRDRKTMILQEIKYWKKHKLLPDQYCDFLLTLYTEGSEYSSKSSVLTRRNIGIASTVIILMTLFSFLVFYFSDFLFQMQMPNGLFFIIFLSVFLLSTFSIGVLRSHFTLQCTSILSLLLMFAIVSTSWFEQHFSWWLFEGSWLIVALLFVVTSYILKNNNKTLSVTLYVNGIVLLFIPSIQGMFIEQASINILQWIVGLKLILFMISLFVWHPLRYIADFDKK